MKKILIVLLITGSSIIFHGCNTDSKITSQDEKYSKCADKKTTAEKDECLLLSYGWGKVTEKNYTYNEEDRKICDAITQNTYSQDKCNWIFAMKSKDSSICDYLPSSIEEISDVEHYEDEDRLTKAGCKIDLHYQYEDANWTLETGFPPSGDPETMAYKGNAQISGWIIQEPGYTEGEYIKYFKISDKSLKNIPPSMQRIEFFSVSKESIPKLEKYDEKNPATIIIDQIVSSRDPGSMPFLNILEILE